MTPNREQRILELLADDPSLILIFKNKYTTENMWKFCIENEPSLFQYMKNPSEDIVIYALSEDGANIKYLKDMGIALTPKMIYAAVKSYPGAIYLIPEELRTTRLREFACKEDPSLMRELSLKNDYIEKRLKEDPTLVRFLKNPTEDQICSAIEADPNICAYVEKFTPRVKALIKELYPELIPLIPRLSEQFSD